MCSQHLRPSRLSFLSVCVEGPTKWLNLKPVFFLHLLEQERKAIRKGHLYLLLNEKPQTFRIKYKEHEEEIQNIGQSGKELGSLMGSELAKRTCVNEGQHCSLWKIFNRLWGPNRSQKTWLKDQGNETLISFVEGIILCFKFYLK